MKKIKVFPPPYTPGKRSRRADQLGIAYLPRAGRPYIGRNCVLRYKKYVLFSDKRLHNVKTFPYV